MRVARCPQAAIAYDLFHVVARYCREVIDRVRVDEANRLRHERAGRRRRADAGGDDGAAARALCVTRRGDVSPESDLPCSSRDRV